MKTYKIDEELEKLMPELMDEEKESLRDSFAKYGFKGAPIIVWNDTIIDGHNRYQICQDMGIEPEIREMSFESKDEAVEGMLSTQFARRNLNNAQKIQIASKQYRATLEEEAKRNQGRRTDIERQNMGQTFASCDKNGKVRERLAKITGTSAETVRKCEQVLNSGDEQLIKDMLSGKKSINAASNKIKNKRFDEAHVVASGDNDTHDIRPTIIRGRKDKHVEEDGLSDYVLAPPTGETIIDPETNMGLEERFTYLKEQFALIDKYIMPFRNFLEDDKVQYYNKYGDEAKDKKSDIGSCFNSLDDFCKLIASMELDVCDDEIAITINK